MLTLNIWNCKLYVFEIANYGNITDFNIFSALLFVLLLNII